MLAPLAKTVLAIHQFPSHLIVRSELTAAGSKILMSGFEKGQAAAFPYGSGKYDWSVIAGTEEELDLAERLYKDFVEGIR